MVDLSREDSSETERLTVYSRIILWVQPTVKELPTFPFPWFLLLGCNRQAQDLWFLFLCLLLWAWHTNPKEKPKGKERNVSISQALFFYLLRGPRWSIWQSCICYLFSLSFSNSCSNKFIIVDNGRDRNRWLQIIYDLHIRDYSNINFLNISMLILHLR